MLRQLPLTLRPGYFTCAIVLFITEAVIAACLQDRWIRPYGGDYLVVILVYCALRSCLPVRVWPAAVAALLLAYAVEIGQYFHLIVRLGWQHSLAARLILGTGFSWIDMLMYTLGFLSVVGIETARRRLLFPRSQ